MGIIRTYKFSESFNYKEITQNAIETFRAKVLKDAIIIEKDNGYAFIFTYGIAIFWDIEGEEFILNKLQSTPASCKSSEEFNFKHSNVQSIKIEMDTIFIDKLDELTMLSVSFAIAQSLKLSEFEDAMLESLVETEHIPQELVQYGRVAMKRKEIAQERGRLFLTKSRIYLHFELLDTPEFFWEYPELEGYYLATRKYLEIQPRIEILNRKLNILQEILGILADEQHHKYSSLLEWIIIILIAFEIIIFIFNELL
ncbi:RMD1 family protein [Sulfurovum sp. zt1-1]|uniref:RMD1 family protein n=1 Tax=Sulfurovum zhangzhouensis TaxID=3019067 RepID=A0ABT7QWG0_9BACT|nr:RMD1 family protein [Sulfurovum zhangzhouensis]MDM5271170.1 RMD1 family protein [Sulfurovum zhangzhouensis]